MAYGDIEKFYIVHYKLEEFDMTFEILEDGQVPDLTGWSAICQWRKFISQETPDIEFSTQNGRIPALTDNGIIRMLADVEDISALEAGKYNTEVMIISPQNQAYVYGVGTFELRDQNTRP